MKQLMIAILFVTILFCCAWGIYDQYQKGSKYRDVKVEKPQWHSTWR